MAETVQGTGARWRPGGVCSFLLCDLSSFSDGARSDAVRVHVRQAMYAGLGRSLAEAGLSLDDDCYHEDRGDGVMVIVPPRFSAELLLTTVLGRLRAEVRRHNEVSSEAAQMRLRLAVGVGQAEADERGVVGTALTHAFRLLDAEPLRQAVRMAATGLALIVSQRVYEDVIRHGRGLIDPGDYYSVEVRVKETMDAAWITVPGLRPPPTQQEGAAVLSIGESSLQPRRAALDGGPEGPRELPRLDEAAAAGLMFEAVEELLNIPRLRSERGRDQVIGVLSPSIAGAVPRSGDARGDLFAILQTCLDYPGGLQQLLAAIRGLVGQSMAMGRLEGTIARLLIREQPGTTE